MDEWLHPIETMGVSNHLFLNMKHLLLAPVIFMIKYIYVNIAEKGDNILVP